MKEGINREDCKTRRPANSAAIAWFACEDMDANVLPECQPALLAHNVDRGAGIAHQHPDECHHREGYNDPTKGAGCRV